MSEANLPNKREKGQEQRRQGEVLYIQLIVREKFEDKV